MDTGRDLLSCARRACAVAAEAVVGNLDRGLIDHRSGYRTHSDVLANQAIITELRSDFPDIPIFSEEGGVGAASEGPLWIVDPLDGTWNHHHGGSKWSISIAAVDAGGPICAVVHAPLIGEVYEYTSGMMRPVMNGDPISPSTSSFPGEWIIAAGAPSHARSRASQYLENLSRDIDTGDPLRPARINKIMYGRGSMALELCHLASGRIDGVLRFGQWAWDLAGGLCIANGAGCQVEAFDESPLRGRLHSLEQGCGFDVIGSSTLSNLSILRRIASGGSLAMNGIKNK